MLYWAQQTLFHDPCKFTKIFVLILPLLCWHLFFVEEGTTSTMEGIVSPSFEPMMVTTLISVSEWVMLRFLL